MTDAKHTPGPWWKDDAYPDDVYRNIIGQDCALVARVGVNGTPGGGAGEADADLIAAAPELLEALQWCVAQGYVRYTARIKGQNEAHCDGVDRVHDAIAKATGSAR